MTTSKLSDTDKFEGHVCLSHSGVCENIKNVKGDIVDVWSAIGQIRVMFAVTMLSAVGTLIMMLWAILANKVGL